jgi:hypothetical protein
MSGARDENDAKKVKDGCDYCSYVPKNFVDYVKHLEKKHPEGGSAKTGG